MPKSPPTMYEVARHAGVPIATASRVQRGNGQVAARTRARVVRSIEALDYRPSPSARSLAVSRHDAAGIVSPDLSGPYYSEVIYGFEHADRLGRHPGGVDRVPGSDHRPAADARTWCHGSSSSH